MSEVLLCADQACLANPSLLGLEGETFDAQPWLRVFSQGMSARAYLAQDDKRSVEEAWIVSSDDIDGLNLAAALRYDHPELPVYWVSFHANGSSLSRAGSAGLTGVLSRNTFLKRYLERKANAIVSAREGETRASVGQEGETALRGQEASNVSDERAGATKTLPTPKATLDRQPADRQPADRQPADHQPAEAQAEEGLSKDPRENAAAVVAVDDAVTHVRQIPHRAVQTGTIVSVVSGSGGVGKSALAAILACEGVRRGMKTALLDADFQFGDEEFYLGADEPLRVGDVLSNPAKLDRLPRTEKLPALIAPPKQVEQADLLEGKMEFLLAELQSRFELVVVNTGGSWTEQTLDLIERSNRTIMLMDQRTSSIRSCQHAYDLCLRCGIATGSLLFLLNRCSKKSPFTSLDISCALQGASVIEVRDGGYEVEELLASGLATELVQSKNWLARSVRDIWDDIFSADDSTNRKRHKQPR